jgi:hypothetical protein
MHVDHTVGGKFQSRCRRRHSWEYDFKFLGVDYHIVLANLDMIIFECVEESSDWPSHLGIRKNVSDRDSLEAQAKASSFGVTVTKKSYRAKVSVGEVCTLKDVNGHVLEVMWVPKCRAVEGEFCTIFKRAKLRVEHSGFEVFQVENNSDSDNDVAC